MNLVIRNTPDLKFNPYIKKALNFYGENLISKRILKNITINVIFKDKMDVQGLAEIEDYNTKKEPREFNIILFKYLGSFSIIKTLAHEMVHVKQYINHEINEYLSSWKGNYIDSDNLDYWKHPWEIEAFGLEVSLYSQFRDKEKLWEVFSDIRNPSAQLIKKNIEWI